MKQLLAVATILVSMQATGSAADKFSFPHAAELTSQAKQIVWQEVNESKIPNSQHQEMICLAENIYFESRAEGVEGKAAVANVTRNRVESEQFPNTYCGVQHCVWPAMQPALHRYATAPQHRGRRRSCTLESPWPSYRPNPARAPRPSASRTPPHKCGCSPAQP